MEKAALFCDETVSYRIPAEPEPGDTVTLRFRTAKDDADHVNMVLQGEEKKIELVKAESRGRFDYYETAYPVGDAAVCFYFEILKGKERYLYNRLGVVENIGDPVYMFRIPPGFHVPDWAKGALMYQIFIDRFYNGDSSNDVVSNE